jgi:hypothetical protein
MDDDLNRPNNNTAKPGNSKGDNTANEAVEFLTQLRQPPWILIAINPDKPRDNITAITAQSAEDARVFVSRHDGTSNLYYSVNPTKAALSKKPAKTDIAAVEYLLGDLDPRKDEKSEVAKSRYLHQLNGAFEPKPTAIVDSGNGIQALWRLNQAIDLSHYPLTTDDKGKSAWGPEAEKIIADAEDRTKALMERLGAKAGTQNIDRILRLPGTINLPTNAKIEAGRERCPTKLLAFNGASYPLNAFVPGSPEDGGHHARQDLENEGQSEPGAHEEGGDKLERIIREGENGEFDGDRSRAVWWAINELLRRGYLTSMIVCTLLDRKNKISDHIYAQKQPRKYAERQVVEAKKNVKVPAEAKDKPPPESKWVGQTPATPPPELIKGVLPQTGVATIGGQSGSGKSFQAIHLGVHLIPDCKQQVYIDRYRIKRHGGVLYLVLEGKPAFHMRVSAALCVALNKQMTLGERATLPFSWNTYEPNLFSVGPDKLIKLAERDAAKMKREFGIELVAIFLDTMGLAACYENEDKAAQVQKVVSGLFQLRGGGDQFGVAAKCKFGWQGYTRYPRLCPPAQHLITLSELSACANHQDPYLRAQTIWRAKARNWRNVTSPTLKFPLYDGNSGI